MAASWLDREPGVAVALEQMRRVLEGGIKSAGVSLLLSVAAGAFAVVLVVLFAADFAPRYVLRVVEMDRDPETLVNPKRQLGEYVHTAVFTSKALLPIIERNALFPSLVKTNRRAAIEAFREDIEIEVYENYFLEQRSAHDAPRSARLAVRFRHSNRGVALAVTRELGELVVRHEQKSRQEAADRAARDANAVRDRAERNLSLRRARVVEKQLEVERGGDPLAEVELVSLLGSLPAREREVERASRRASRLDLAAALERHGVGVGFEVVDDGSIPRSAELGARKRALVFLGALITALPFAAALVGAHRDRGGSP